MIESSSSVRNLPCALGFQTAFAAYLRARADRDVDAMGEHALSTDLKNHTQGLHEPAQAVERLADEDPCLRAISSAQGRLGSRDGYAPGPLQDSVLSLVGANNKPPPEPYVFLADLAVAAWEDVAASVEATLATVERRADEAERTAAQLGPALERATAAEGREAVKNGELADALAEVARLQGQVDYFRSLGRAVPSARTSTPGGKKGPPTGVKGVSSRLKADGSTVFDVKWRRKDGEQKMLRGFPTPDEAVAARDEDLASVERVPA